MRDRRTARYAGYAWQWLLAMLGPSLSRCIPPGSALCEVYHGGTGQVTHVGDLVHHAWSRPRDITEAGGVRSSVRPLRWAV